MSCGTAVTVSGMTDKIEFGIAGGPIIIEVTTHDDGTRTFEIPGMHLDLDLDAWVPDDTTAGGTGVETTNLDGEGSTPSSGATDLEAPVVQPEE